ncbi:hypothetical protein L917_17137, partial [Phytophthora nicotianae]
EAKRENIFITKLTHSRELPGAERRSVGPSQILNVILDPFGAWFLLNRWFNDHRVP